MENANNTVMITGCSSGFGNLTAKKFLQENWNVVVTMRDIEKGNEFKNNPNALLLKLDVTDLQECEIVAQKAIERFGKIDVLVNNAGYAAMGMFECGSKEEIQHQMDVNFMGTINATQAVLPHMRVAKKGKIINISSIVGRVGFGGMSFYNASKFAVEGLSESLRVELDEFNIKVQIIEPGMFKTGFVKSANINNGRIAKGIEGKVRAYHEKLISSANAIFNGNPKDVANLIYNCAINKVKKFRNPVGKDAKALFFIKTILPDWLFFRVVKAMRIYK